MTRQLSAVGYWSALGVLPIPDHLKEQVNDVAKEPNAFTKLAAAMANVDLASEDTSQLDVTEMSDALKALADVALTDFETFQAGWQMALKAAARRLGKKG